MPLFIKTYEKDSAGRFEHYTKILSGMHRRFSFFTVCNEIGKGIHHEGPPLHSTD